MALESSKNSVVEQLCKAGTLPRMIRVRQIFNQTHLEPDEIPAVIAAQLARDAVRKNIKPGMSIAITCGSRGITNIATIIKAIVDYVKAQGGKPFIFPAMGSHGGATVQGQLNILESYHVMEETMGCPIRATMEAVYLGDTVEGSPVYQDCYAHEADGVILCGRIKAHTSFQGAYESGLLKMSVIVVWASSTVQRVSTNPDSRIWAEFCHSLPRWFSTTPILWQVSAFWKMLMSRPAGSLH